MAEKNLGSWSLDMSSLSLQTADFLVKRPFLSTNACLLNYWLLSSEQMNLSLRAKSM